MTTLDGRLPAPENGDSAQPIGRVNIRPPGTEDYPGGWNLQAVLFGVVALAIMLAVMVFVLNGVFEPPAA